MEQREYIQGTEDESRIRESMASDVWTTKDGKAIPISELTDDHLSNIIKMLKSKGWVHSSVWESCLCFAGSCRGDMASYAAEQELDNMRFSLLTDNIFDEYDRREING